jgi:hypothetical protein
VKGPHILLLLKCVQSDTARNFLHWNVTFTLLSHLVSDPMSLLNEYPTMSTGPDLNAVLIPEVGATLIDHGTSRAALNNNLVGNGTFILCC